MSHKATQPVKDNPRATAVSILLAVIYSGRSLTGQLARGLPALEKATDRRLAQELSFGVLRWYTRLQGLTTRLLRKPFKARDRDIQVLVLLGLYQLLYLDKPAHAVIDETVQVTRLLSKPWATAVVNAVLRTCQRRQEELLAELDKQPEARWAHPAWMLTRFQTDWPDHWQEIAEANNQRPPLVLRVNARHHTATSYAQLLQAEGVAAEPVPGCESALYLPVALPVDALPGFEQGWVSVQDAGAQLAAELLDAGPGERILDACAAPGGKTCHILERQPGIGEVVALDIAAERLQQVEANLQRLALKATLRTADAVATDRWWDGKPFARILLDAPCSASGVIRRHPDIKVLRREADIAPLVARQQQLLRALWPLLAPGGMLLYVTCSVLKCENSDQIQCFMAAHPDCVVADLVFDFGHSQPAGWQILPGERNMDGFYYACLTKR